MVGGLTFVIHVRPGASRVGVDGEFDGVLAIRVTAPPSEGRANTEVVDVLAQALGVRRTDVHVVSGARSRRKIVHVDGAPNELDERLRQLMDHGRA
ncbi:MAG: hypothetical protein RI958_2812 [Actinomycetota bacterium]|jgi:uncharacterized protein (TIGR00251 family)